MSSRLYPLSDSSPVALFKNMGNVSIFSNSSLVEDDFQIFRHNPLVGGKGNGMEFNDLTAINARN